MCGIVGIKFFSKSPEKSDQKSVLKALELQKHRGPDFSDAKLFGNMVLGHNRLAILDLDERSNQPFFDSTDRYGLIFNGEIYNYPELKNDLLLRGYVFSTSSDTEVLLFALIEFGEEIIKDLDGCFSFAFYDKQEDQLILARDHMGINPLLFSIQDDGVFFASELNAFTCFNIKNDFDEEALNNYFAYTYIAAPKTVFKQIQKLYPGHYLKVKGKSLDIIPYWSKSKQVTIPKKKDEVHKKAREILERSVLKRMHADVPLGTFLSGGIDSSIVSAIAADFKSDLKTFSVGFKDAHFFDESTYAEMVAKHIGSQHYRVEVTLADMVAELPKILDSFDEPFADSSAVAMYFLAKAAKKELTVCLSGDGADELLAGYNKHSAFMKASRLSGLEKSFFKLGKLLKSNTRDSYFSNKLRQFSKFGTLVSKDWPANYWYLAAFNDNETIQQLLKKELTYDYPIALGDASLNSFLLADQSYVLQGDMLKKVDVMSMRHSLEVRVPFLDKEWVAFTNSLPEHYKFQGGKGKILLREAFSDLLPQVIFERKKQGFEIPLRQLLITSWESVVKKEWFDKDFIFHQDIFNYNFVYEIQKDFEQKKQINNPTLVWSYIVFQHWYSKWKEKK